MDHESFSIREAIIEDVSALELLVNSAFRGESSKKGWTTEEHLLGGQRTDKDTLELMIVTPSNTVLIAESNVLLNRQSELLKVPHSNDSHSNDPQSKDSQSKDSQSKDSQSKNLLACVLLTKKNNLIYLGMLTVSPDQQGLGVGKYLLKASEKFAVKKNCLKIEMTVIAQRIELIDWYKRHGYVQTDEVRPFPYGNPRFGEPKIENLHFIVLEKHL